MKYRIKKVINEARVQRTIDNKIWASMSSMSSRLRSTLAAEAKPMKRDTYDVLLQKYVAGLLTMKVPCPNTVADISKNQAYQNIGNAFIEQGGTIQEIQKLYQENGGVLTTNTLQNNIEDNTSEEDFPEYDDVEADTQKNDSFDAAINKHNTEHIPTNDYPEYDDVEINNDIKKSDYPDYDDVETDDVETDDDVDKPDFSDNIEDESDMTTYLKTLSFKFAKPNSYLIWDKSNGFVLSQEDDNSVAKCISRYANFVDNKPRFLVMISDNEITLGNSGNNNVYEDYYYKTDNKGYGSRLRVNPGSNYYTQEEKKGEFYTNILADNSNNAAMFVKNIDISDMIELDGLDELQQQEIVQYFKDNMYLPTLPELSKIISQLPKGKYWTSSIVGKGSTNLILSVQPDKVIRTNNISDRAKVIVFIKF